MKGAKRIGKWVYLAGECIGRGGNGVVYPAYLGSDEARATKYVIKILENAGSAERIARMRLEIEVLSRLNHPNILRVVDHDLAADKPYLIAPFYNRQSLTFDHINTLPPADRLRFFAIAARAFGHAHEQGITHRDIKPENILLMDDGQPLVADFGICHVAEGTRHTATVAVMASRFCTAPEVEGGRAKEITPACDVYCLGKLLYWMFSGRMLPREDLREGDYDLTLQEPRSIHAFVYQLLDRMILKDPAGRLLNGNAVAEIAETLAERIAMDAHVLDLNIPQRCDFCKAGNYEIRVDPQWWTGSFRPGEGIGSSLQHADQVCRSYGLGANPGAPWLILQCAHCGHVQVFQLFHATEPLKNWVLKKRA